LKKLTTYLLAIIMLLTLLETAYAEAPHEDHILILDGAEVVNQRTMLPMRSIFEALGAEVLWDNPTRTVTATKEDIVVILQINSSTATINNTVHTLDVPPMISHNKTMVPARFASEALGAEVIWNQEHSRVEITTTDTRIHVLLGTSQSAAHSDDDEVNRIKNFQSLRQARAAHKDGWIYYYKTWGSSGGSNMHDPKANGLFKERLDGTLDGTDRVQLAKEEIYSLTLVGDWIYYTSYGDDQYGRVTEGPYELYKVSLDGKKKVKLLDLHYPSDVTFIDNDWIYYSPDINIHGPVGKRELYRMDTDGKNKTFITELEDASAGLYQMQVVDDYIYYGTGFNGFHRVKVDGTEHHEYDYVSVSDLSGFIIQDGWIYYSMYRDLQKATLDESKIVQLVPGDLKVDEAGHETYVGTPLYGSNLFSFHIKGDLLYYTDNVHLHTYNLKTGEVTKLNNEPTHIIMLGDYIYSSVDTYGVPAKLIPIK